MTMANGSVDMKDDFDVKGLPGSAVQISFWMNVIAHFPDPEDGSGGMAAMPRCGCIRSTCGFAAVSRSRASIIDSLRG